MEHKAYLSSQIITYIGNKRALGEFILSAVEQVKVQLGREKLAMGDLFSGSGIVSRMLKGHASYLAVNDFEGYCRTISRCYLSNSSQRDMPLLQQAYRQVLEGVEGGLRNGFIAELYAPADDAQIRPGERVFYTRRNAMYLDTARQEIEKLPEELRHFFIAPLLSEASVKANTSGVFKGFYKNSRTGVGQFGGDRRNALSRICADISLPFPVFSRYDCPVDIFCQDAGTLPAVLPPLDLVYLDPPYNQHPYGSNYFMLNLLDTYRRPEKLSRVSGIPEGWQRSDYNKSRRSLEALQQLCGSLNARYLLISFNSEGFISRQEMEQMLQGIGQVQVLEQQYNTFRGSRNLRQREIHVKEYLFLVRKG